jgi:hypothetical protein
MKGRADWTRVGAVQHVEEEKSNRVLAHLAFKPTLAILRPRPLRRPASTAPRRVWVTCVQLHVGGTRITPASLKCR